ncbi:DoxX family protein [Bdellovibrio sp. HCB-162]|uniref:DoxX family protein n=1 Tax=Bdellovibrio sp. HCB-162 TaxID=3394234 RepID=UPI0039BD55B2
MILKTLATDKSYTEFFLRVALGVMILPHGLQKTFGAFGGYGYTGTMQFFTETMGIPAPLAFLAIAAEFAGGLALILGLGTRWAAILVGTVMAVALTSHVQNGFFMNWFGNQKGEGWEFHLLAIAIALALVVRGGGAYSTDLAVSKKLS